MKKIKSSQRGLTLSYADFIKQVRGFRFESLSDEALLSQLQRSVGPHESLAKAYGILTEIIRRKTGLSLFDSQLAAAYSMQQGHIAELPTGEGKTLSAVITAAIFALKQRPVHILVFNDYLAHRDFTANRPIFEACGLTCGYIEATSSFKQRKSAYACDVVYVSAKEVAFDHLRDFLCRSKEELLFPPFSVALVDEADSILIDEARIPLVLAGNSKETPSGAAMARQLVSALGEPDVCANVPDNQVWLTDSGIEKAEKTLGLGNLFSIANTGTLALLHAALEAEYLVKRDRNYIIKDGAVLVIDESTGRVAENRRFPDLLQQAVEAKEVAAMHTQTVVYNSTSMQAFLSAYKTLCGMTGTAASSKEAFRQMYNLEVDVIEPHTPCVRRDYPDKIFSNPEAHQKAVLEKIQAVHKKGQPILIGTQSVKESERYSALLTALSLNHSVLNAKNDDEEARIIAEAGRPHQITISTNMAGRGVDIRLGGSKEAQADFVRRAGGLFVLSTGINRSVRVDNQLRGRAGRQGDPGESQFYICMRDVRLDTFFDLEFYRVKRYPKLLRRAQKLQEGQDAEARYMLTRYSDILEQKRKQVTDYRTQVLFDKTQPDLLKSLDASSYQELMKRHGESAVRLAERQLTLYFINEHWANYLAAMEDKRNGIHLMLVGGKNPLEEYHRFALSAFEEMTGDIKSDVVRLMKQLPITENGIDMESAGLSGATTTWTYQINESASQFCSIPHLMKSLSTQIQGTVFTLRGLWHRLKKARLRRFSK